MTFPPTPPQHPGQPEGLVALAERLDVLALDYTISAETGEMLAEALRPIREVWEAEPIKSTERQVRLVRVGMSEQADADRNRRTAETLKAAAEAVRALAAQQGA